jgi:hypothetical protein
VFQGGVNGDAVLPGEAPVLSEGMAYNFSEDDKFNRHEMLLNKVNLLWHQYKSYLHTSWMAAPLLHFYIKKNCKTFLVKSLHGNINSCSLLKIWSC